MDRILKLTNAKVEVMIVSDGKKDMLLRIIVDDKFIHTFEASSRETRLLNEMELSVLQKKFDGGTYVFSETGQLVDYRTSEYKGFIHSDEAIRTLSEKIGCTVSNVATSGRRPVGDVFSQFREDKGNFLGGLSEPFYLDIASLGDGGSFKNKIVYKWNPFDENIFTTIEVERLVCKNGMVGISPLVTRKVPVINDWERHLEIVSLQIQPNINTLLQDRFVKMADTHASVSHTMEARAMLLDRSQLKAADSVDQLTSLIQATDVESRLKSIYRDDVFRSPLGRSAASDLTQFDLFNILTQACSHTAGSVQSNERIQKFLNKTTFDFQKNEIAGNAKISQESDHRRVFFGKNKKGDE